MAVSAKNKIAWVVIDDSFYFLKNLTTNQNLYTSIFDEPILRFYKKLHDSYGTVFLLALFYCEGYNPLTQTHSGWDISQCTDKWKAEFQANSSWLKMGFHSWHSAVRYNAYRNDSTETYDFSRDMIADFNVIKTEAIRIGGAETWNDISVNHFYDNRKADVDALKNYWNVQVGYTMQNKDRGQCGYLNLAQQQRLNNDGYYYDESNGVLFCIRDFAFERINGTLKVQGTPNRTIDYLNYYNHRSKTFMNPETHEVQIQNGPSKQYPVKKELNDFCAWCNNRGYNWKFPTKSDFNII
jgi:hypothetical protein